MADYPYGEFSIISATNPDNLAGQNDYVLIHAPGDAARTPIEIRDLGTGQIIGNPIASNRLARCAGFIATIPEAVAYAAGPGIEVLLESTAGMRNVAVESATAAANSEVAAQTAATEAAAAAQADLEARIAAGNFKGEPGDQGLPGVNAVPADEAVGTYATTPGTKTHDGIAAVAVSAIEDSLGGAPLAGPLVVPTYDGNPDTGHPSVVEVPGGFGGYRYWMAHTPYPLADRENPSIVASHNGIDWETPAGLVNPVTPLSEINAAGFTYGSDTHLIHHQGKLWMYYRLAHGGQLKNAILLKTSTNGVTWSAATKVLEDLTAETTLNSPTVEVEANGTFSMWCANYAAQPPTMTRRTSTDGIAWSGPTTCTLPAGALVWHIDVKRVGSTYHCLFNSAEGKQGDQLYYFTSTDGLTWTGDTKVPAIGTDTGTFPTDRFYRSVLVPRIGSSVRWDVYLTMISADPEQDWRIGLIRDTVLPTPRQTTARLNMAQARTDALFGVDRWVAGDNFGRADNTGGLGVSSTGHTWVTLSGSPQVKDRAPFAAATARAYIETGIADAEVAADITALGEVFLLVRATDSANWWRFGTDNVNGRISVSKFAAGALTSVYTGSPNVGSGRPLRVGDRFRVVAQGSTYKIYRNTILLHTFTDSFNSTATKHGLSLSASTGQVKAFGVGRIA